VRAIGASGGSGLDAGNLRRSVAWRLVIAGAGLLAMELWRIIIQGGRPDLALFDPARQIAVDGLRRRLRVDAVEKFGFLLIVTVFRLRCTGSCY
jgi:hypothetical protein